MSGGPLSPWLARLVCAREGHEHPPLPWRGLCECGSPLAARYDLEAIGRRVRRERVAARRPGLWRYRELLPLGPGATIADLGEGGTPLRPARRLGRRLGLRHLWIKEESGNPTGSFKARGLSVAAHVAVALGRRDLAAPSAGNAALALAAYAAALEARAHLFLPRDTPRAIVVACRALGAEIELVDGLITDAGRRLRERATETWADLSTLREPYRLEGKKTLGYELAEDLDGSLPDVVLYPTGGGTGLLGMWKAFEELEALGWIPAGRRPRMVSVQAEGCAPIVRAFEEGEPAARAWPDAETAASGLRVPSALADFWILRVLRESGGGAIAVPEAELLAATLELTRSEGVVASPEGGAVLAALRRLIDRGEVRPDDRVVLFQTGTGLTYLEALEAALAGEARAGRSGPGGPPA